MRIYKQDLIAALGEFVGTTLFLRWFAYPHCTSAQTNHCIAVLAFGGAKTAQVTRTTSQLEGLSTSLGNQTILFIAVSFGLSLLVNAWVFYRVTGGLFNPACVSAPLMSLPDCAADPYASVTLALFATGGLSVFRCVLLIVSQLCGGIAAAALVAALTPFGGAESLKTTLGTGVNVTQGLFIEVCSFFKTNEDERNRRSDSLRKRPS